jgi:predicted DNA-binding transcriptional regulator YafY
MPRADRLYELIQILRDGGLHRARDLASAFGVSDRTIWRDMETLMASGLPVEGERGVGYLLRAPITLPPMTISMAELEALRRGLSHIAGGTETPLARAAGSLAARIASVIPAAAFPEDDELFVFTGEAPARPVAHLPILHAAIRKRERLRLAYVDREELETVRTVRPLSLETEGGFRLLVAWCERRRDFRQFRLDRILQIEETGQAFPREPGRELADWRLRA